MTNTENESSNNEKYQKKFERYKKSDFIWNELMVGHLDVVDQRNIPAEWFLECIDPDHNGAFPRSKVESRQRSIFAVIKKIWLDETDKKL